MTDTTNTTATATAPAPVYGPLQFNVTPAPLDPSFDALRELTRAQDRAREAEAATARLMAEVERLRSEQIIDGADPRLERFWERAGRIADYADYCSEYDRMAEELNGPGRTREFEVSYDVTLTVPVTVTVSARDEDAADDVAREEIDEDRIIEAIRDSYTGDHTATYTSAVRA